MNLPARPAFKHLLTGALPAARLRHLYFAVGMFAAVFALSVAALGLAYDRGVKPFFYQSYFEPAVRIACGEGFAVDKRGPGLELGRFLALARQKLDCRDVPRAAEPDSAPQIRIWYHMMYAVGYLWKLTGPNWRTVDYLASGLLALTAVIVLALFRQFMPLWLAAPFALLAVVPGLRFLPYFRDLNKAPFILAAIAIALWLVMRTPRAAVVVAVCALTGVWLGIGYGFRPDVLIGLPVVAGAVLFFLPWRADSRLTTRILGVFALFAGFALAASPIFALFAGQTGSCHWHFALLGLSDLNTGILSVGAAPYSYLSHFSDELIWSAVESYSGRVLGTSEVGYCTPAYDQVSRALYFELFAQFPADFVARGLAAARIVVTYGLAGAVTLIQKGVSIGVSPEPLQEFIQWTQRSSGTFIRVVLCTWVLALLLVMARNLRLGLFLLAGVVYLCAYPAVQFDWRHVFHLAFLTWLPFAILVAVYTGRIRYDEAPPPCSGSELRCPMRTAVLVLSGLVIVCVLLLWTLRWYQRGNAVEIFERYLRAESAAIALPDPLIAEGRALWKVPEPGRPSTGNAESKVHGRLLRVSFGAGACTPGKRSIAMDLVGSRPDSFIRTTLDLELRAPGGITEIFLPVYFRRGETDTMEIAVKAADQGCIGRIAWVTDGDVALPWLRAVLPPDWKSRRLYQRIS